MILGALNDVGGQAYLAEQALANPGVFLMLVSKVLPTTIVGDRNNPLEITVTLEARRQRARAEIAEAFGPVVITDAVSVVTNNGQMLLTDVTNESAVPDMEDG